MRKNHIFILIIFISIFFLFLYAISSGGLKSGIRQREENIIIYNNIIKAINSSKADYQVLTGREGGTFTFEIDFKNGDGTESISYMLQAIGFTRISTKRIVYCNNLRGVRLLEKNEKMILEYQRKLSECIEAAVSGGKGKENSESETWQNNQLQAGKIVTNSANGKLLLDATNVKANRWEGEVQDFEAKSRQDVTKYSSEQVQAGGSVSVTYGSGGGATFNAAYNSAKLNTAQVENQTAIDIGKGGMDVKVKKNAHFEGAVMSSQAEKENNLFQASTLTTVDIENHSELKTRSAAMSGGSGGVNPMSALSLLGNKNESERSTTRAAIGENIAITLTQDPNAETTLNHLNRDTQNANQKVTKHDISEVKETQELVKGIGEIAEKAYQIYTHSEREKVTEAKLALGKVETRLRNEGKTKEEIAQHPEYKALKQDLNDKQQTFDNAYGTGSKTKRAVEAVTAALQGLAAKDVGQAAVGLASPYLNAEIKKYTEGDTQANLIAHALLGAVEAAATGNNVLAGAAAGAGSEAAADFIIQTLYDGKSTQDLTEAEKQNVTFLSQLAGGLASGIIGDSTQSAVVGADIGKRAVENNYLLVDYSQLKGLTKTDTEQGQRINEKLEKAGVENIDDYATQYRACGDNSSCQRQVIDAEMEAISRSYDIINELAKSGELSKNDIDFIQSTLVPRARGAYDSKTKDEATRVVYRSGDLETFAKSEQRLAEARFSAQLKSWVDQGLTDEQIQHKLENEPLAIALSTAGPNIGGRQPSGSGMSIPTFANARQTLLQIRALSKQASDFSVEVPSTVSAKDRQVTVTETVGYGKGTTNLRVSTGAENVALYPKLKEQLKLENLSNIVSKSPILEHAAFGKGNLTVKGTVTKKEVERLAIEWIGEKPILTSNGGMISSDGTRRYRPADIKKNSKYAESGVQANFERGYTDSSGKFISESNLHLNIKKD